MTGGLVLSLALGLPVLPFDPGTVPGIEVLVYLFVPAAAFGLGMLTSICTGVAGSAADTDAATAEVIDDPSRRAAESEFVFDRSPESES
jgi:hypothetical protein